LAPTHSIEGEKDILNTIALRQLKQRQELDSKLDEMCQRLPPSKKEIVQFLERQLSSVWVRLPTLVINTLAKAESYYQTKVNDDDAKVHFVKAVEASLDYCFVNPLIDYMQKRKYKHIAVCFPPPRGRQMCSERSLRRLSLSEWAEIFKMLAAPRFKGSIELGMPELLEFVKQRYEWQRLPDLRPLAQSLQAI